MMPCISEEDKRIMEEIDKWLYFGDDGWFHLREDAPEKIKQNYLKIREKFKDL